MRHIALLGLLTAPGIALASNTPISDSDCESIIVEGTKTINWTVECKVEVYTEDIVENIDYCVPLDANLSDYPVYVQEGLAYGVYSGTWSMVNAWEGGGNSPCDFFLKADITYNGTKRGEELVDYARGFTGFSKERINLVDYFGAQADSREREAFAKQLQQAEIGAANIYETYGTLTEAGNFTTSFTFLAAVTADLRKLDFGAHTSEFVYSVAALNKVQKIDGTL